MHYFIYILFFLLVGCQAGFHRGPVTDHFDGQEFYYPGEKNKPHNQWYDLLNLWVAILQNPWPTPLPTIIYPNFVERHGELKVTFINHSTVLVESHQGNILFDPIYSDRASPIPFIGPKRVHPPGIVFSMLPKVDVVLISHNHYDHMDMSTLQTLNTKFHPLFIVPLGNKIVLQHHGIRNVEELDWWEKSKSSQVNITFLPAHHTTQRGLMDFNRTLWGSFGVILEGKKLYFAGDTSYREHFKIIHSRWGKPFFSMLPIGAYEPRELCKEHHMNPNEAVKAHLDLGSTYSLGIHWGTFQLSTESLDQPVKDLALARNAWKVADDKFFVLSPGKPYYLERSSAK